MDATHDSKHAKNPADLQEIRTAAHFLIAKGHVPLPLPNGQKRPLLDGWETKTIGIDDVDSLFVAGCNVGVRLDRLTDLDLDAPEARALAQYFVNPSASRWGRDTARQSHHLYAVQ